MRPAKPRRAEAANAVASSSPTVSAAAPCGSSTVARCSARAPQPRGVTARRSSCAPTKTSARSRHEGDTVDLLQAGVALAHEFHGGVAQEARAATARRFLQRTDRLARDDHLAQFVAEHHDLGDRAAALEAGA